MANLDLIVLEGGKQKRKVSSAQTIDFLAVRVGAGTLSIAENSGAFALGASLEVTGNISATGNIHATGNADVDGTFDVAGATTLAALSAVGVVNFVSATSVSVPAPTSAAHAATKSYVDSFVQGLDVKASVRATTTAALDASTYANGTGGVGATLTADANGAFPAQDGVTLVANDRLLVKNQAAGLQNGIYILSTVGSAGAPWVLTRAVDFDDSPDGEVTDGAFTFVGEGTALANTGWVMTTNDPITIGTSALVWTQFSEAGTITAGAGLTKTGNTIDFVAGDASLSVAADSASVARDAAGAIGLSGTGIKANVDAVGIEISANALQLKDAGVVTAKLADDSVTKAKINADVAGNGLVQAVGGELDVNSGDGLEIAADVLKVKVSDIAGAGLEDDGANNLRLAATVAGAGLSHAAGVLAVIVDGSSLEIATDTVQVKDAGITAAKLAAAVAGDGLTGGAGAALAVGAGNGIAVVADSVSVQSGDSSILVDSNGVKVEYDRTLTNNQGGAITVRQFVFISSAGNVQLLSASSVVGPGSTIGNVSDASIADAASGKIAIKAGKLISGFSGLTVGAPLYPSKTTPGSYQQNLTGYVAGDNVVKLGEVISATEVLFEPEFYFEY